MEFKLTSRNAEPSINPTFRGISMDASDERENAEDSIRFNRELDSNEIDESDLQLEKHDDPRISTLLGISMDSSDENENASDSIRFNRELDSNEIDESDSQRRKHDDPIISTLHGISMDSRDEPENA
jgi:hypothetical protein